MKRITEITKRDILNLFRNGLEIEDLFVVNTVKYHYFGSLEELEFLKRIYVLQNMPSNDPRFENAEQDIWQHTVNNNDYPYCWVFEDERFELQNGEDEIYLKFLCEIFHPAVRLEKGYWKQFLTEINRLLQIDGYELYSADKISNRDVYGWRVFQGEERAFFVPYSQRNAKDIKEKRINLSISKKARNQIYQFLERCNESYEATSETGLRYNTTIAADVFSDIRQFYVPSYYNDQGKYVETDSLLDFIISNSPFYVFDAIELFARHSMMNDFEIQINVILKLNDIAFRFCNGKIVNSLDAQISGIQLEAVQEVGLKELLQDTRRYYDENNMQIAVEKLWDAFERLKTYYCSSTIDKKKSVEKIVQDMSGGQQPYIELFENEFRELTTIGNKFRIRHHETTKIDIQDKRHFEYFYKRCMSLISTAIQFLDGRNL